MRTIITTVFVLSVFAAGHAFAAGSFIIVTSKASGGSVSYASASASISGSASSSGGSTSTVTYKASSSGGGGAAAVGYSKTTGPIHNGCTGHCSIP